MISLSSDKKETVYRRALAQIRYEGEASAVPAAFRKRLLELIDNAFQRAAEIDKSRNLVQR